MAIESATLQVSGVRCEKCIGRLAGVLRPFDGIVEANANLMGQLSLSWDAERTSREAIAEALRKAGFPPAADV
jgi:copper chaperone CopZ